MLYEVITRTKYSQAMRAAVLDAQGASRTLEMGCYGIGVTRVVAAGIEQNHDERGIALPAALAPFAACLSRYVSKTHGQGRDHCNQPSRITSYTVCYTQLLRIVPGLRSCW